MCEASREEARARFLERERINTVKSSVFYLVLAVCVGLPIWWHTTTVYRASLPQEEVSLLMEKTVQIRVPLYVNFSNELADEDFRDQIATLLQYELSLSSSAPHLSSENAESAGQATKTGHYVRCNYDVIREDLLAKERMNKVTSPSGHFTLFFDILGEDQEITLLRDQLCHVELDPKMNTAYIYTADVTMELEKLVSQVSEFIKSKLVEETSLNYEYASNLRVESFDFSRKDKSKDPKEKQEKIIAPKQKYDLVLTLINPEPERYDRKLIKWEVQRAVSNYLTPYLHSLKDVASFNIASQIIYQVKLGANPKAATHQGVKAWAYSELDIPHLITPVERKIGFTTSNTTIINLATYLSPYEKNPLYFSDKSGSMKSLAYYKGWGAVFLENVNKTLSDRNEEIVLNADYHIAAFIPVINSMIGLKRVNSEILGSQFKLDKLTVTQFELDNLYRRRILHNLATSVSTMDSLITLCDQVRNMVIRDEIRQSVELAMELIEESHSLLEQGKHLPLVLQKSSLATELAEKAFSDPTILAMLYFPEDQKYAIYVPMFVPMSLPLWTSLGILIGYIKTRNKQKIENE